MIKLTQNDEQYLMSYVQPTEDSTFQVRLLASFANGFLTSDGFYKEVYAGNKPKYDIDMPTVFNAASALDLPIGWRDLRSHISTKRCTAVPDDAISLKYIDFDKAIELAQALTNVTCPDTDEDEAHYTYSHDNLLGTWCVLDSKK